jgi:hypothetical protein
MMNLKVLLPFRESFRETGVMRIVAETPPGFVRDSCRTGWTASRRSRLGS